MKKNYFQTILDSNKGLKVVFEQFFKQKQVLENSRIKQLDRFLEDKKVVKEVFSYMNDPERGYDCKWNSYKRRWDIDITGPRMRNILRLLSEKESSWGQFGRRLTQYVRTYKELRANNPDTGVNMLAREVCRLPKHQGLLFAKTLHEGNFCRIGCGGFGHYKVQTTCGNCEIAEQRISKFGFKGFVEFQGDRNYQIPEDKIEEAERLMEGGSQKQTFEKFVKQATSSLLASHLRPKARMPAAHRYLPRGIKGSFPVDISGGYKRIAYDSPVIEDSCIDITKKVAIVIIKAQIDHKAGFGRQYELVVYRITPQGARQIHRDCAYEISLHSGEKKVNNIVARSYI